MHCQITVMPGHMAATLAVRDDVAGPPVAVSGELTGVPLRAGG
jgi:hypothetical protein